MSQDTQAEIKRLRFWLTEISNCRGDNSLAETFARRIRYIARRALAGEKQGGENARTA